MIIGVSGAITRLFCTRQSTTTYVLCIALMALFQHCHCFQPVVRSSWSLLFRRGLSSRMDDLMDEVCGNSTNELLGGDYRFNENQDGWSNIDWNSANISPPPTDPSPVDVHLIKERVVYIKRDDKLRLVGSQTSGNKARKMLALNGLSTAEFPNCVVSYGGPQSNAMVALAAVVRYKNEESGSRKKFVYYTKSLPRFLKTQPSGNLFRAMSLGMELKELSSDDYNQLFGGDWGGNVEAPPNLDPPEPGNSLWVPQGAACDMAYAGARRLAHEISNFWLERGSGKPLSVFVPGGTCSTAVLLHRAMKEMTLLHDMDKGIEVVVIPCVGDEGYARRQMMSLNAALGVPTDDIPNILPPGPVRASYFGALTPSDNYFQFGKPDAGILDTFRVMEKEHDVPLDLLYNAPAWTIMLRHWRTTFLSDSRFADREIMYVHSGGLEGVNSQLLRYKHLNLVGINDIQLPGRNP